MKTRNHTCARGLSELREPIGKLIRAVDSNGQKLLRLLLRHHLLTVSVRPLCFDPLVVCKQDSRRIFLLLAGRGTIEADCAMLLAGDTLGETQPLP